MIMISAVLRPASATANAIARGGRRRAFGSAPPANDRCARPLTVADVERRAVRSDGGDGGDAAATTHFSLSGTGPAFFAWMVGFSHGLRRSGLMKADESNLVGVSGGAMCATLLAADLDMSSDSDVMACGQEQSDRCRDGKQKLGELVSNMMEDLLDERAVERVTNNANLHVAMVGAPNGSLMKAYNQEIELHGKFEDKRDVIDAISASTHLPYVSNGDAVTTYRGREVVDAGCTGQMFVPTSSKNFVNVNIFPPIDCRALARENAVGRYVVGRYSEFNNRAKAAIHAHPYHASEFGLHIFGLDDLFLKPLEEEEALRRHHLGHQAFLSWYEKREKQQE